MQVVRVSDAADARLGDYLDLRDVTLRRLLEAEHVTGFHVHRGALAALHRRPLPNTDEVLTGAQRVVVLEDVVDHTNVGAVLRSAAALNVAAAAAVAFHTLRPGRRAGAKS